MMQKVRDPQLELTGSFDVILFMDRYAEPRTTTTHEEKENYRSSN